MGDNQRWFLEEITYKGLLKDEEKINEMSIEEDMNSISR